MNRSPSMMNLFGSLPIQQWKSDENGNESTTSTTSRRIRFRSIECYITMKGMSRLLVIQDHLWVLIFYERNNYVYSHQYMSLDLEWHNQISNKTRSTCYWKWILEGVTIERRYLLMITLRESFHNVLLTERGILALAAIYTRMILIMRYVVTWTTYIY